MPDLREKHRSPSDGDRNSLPTSNENDLKNQNAEARPAMHGGSRLTLHRRHQVGQEPLEVTVDRIGDGLIWVRGSACGMQQGQTIMIEYRLAEGGRYLAGGEIEAQSPECTVISCDGEWRRVQDRMLVRISTHGLEVKVPPRSAASSDEANPDRFEMLDVSAGGICFETREPFEYGDEFVCQFELPGQAGYALPVRVVRSRTKSGYSDRYLVAVEFVGLDEEHRSALLRWIYQEQTRRNNVARPTS